jgi:aminopeptidase N
MAWPAAAAEKSMGFDEATGRDTRHYPPHVLADFKHMLLEITIPDMNTPKFSAVETLTLSPMGTELFVLPLNARAMTIKSVSCEGSQATFKYMENSKLEIAFEPALPVGKDAVVRIEYSVEDPPFGLVWTPESAAWKGRPAQLHSQGQPETNSYWFPCHDFPNERLTTELAVTVPAGFTVLSNGHLVDHTNTILPGDDTRGMTPVERFHWLQDKPHVSYLVSLIVGKFDIVDVGTKELPMPVYAPLGRGKDVLATFGRTPQMIALNEQLFGAKYPWDKYSQAIVWNFTSGGMENTSCTTLYDTAILEPAALKDHDLDGLISHELGHQWFGDYVTCNSWEHIWLNEGFATYLTALWMEHRDGREAYLRNIRGNFDGLIANDQANAPATVGMCSKVYANTWEPFRRPANPYGKGSSILHMLRLRLGDELFFKGVHEYIERRKLQTAETSDLRQALEDVSGQSLEQFFSQWCFRPGVPHVRVTQAWKDGVLTISGQQTQQIDGDNPAFEFDLPFVVQTVGNSMQRGMLSFRGKAAATVLTANDSAQFVAVNPDLSVLAAIEIEQSEDAWRSQLSSGPTVQSRIDAARGLKKPGGIGATEALRTLAQTPSEPVQLRIEAAHALGARGNLSDLRSLITTCPDSWEVREAALGAMGDMVGSDQLKPETELAASVADQAAYAASRDASLKVKCAAVALIGKLKPSGRPEAVAEAFATASQSEDLRGAAIEAAKSLDNSWALNKVLVLTGPEYDARLRERATGALGELGKHDAAKTFARLSELLKDREFRTRRAAGNALVDLGDARAKGLFEAELKGSRAAEWTAILNDWIRQMDEVK